MAQHVFHTMGIPVHITAFADDEKTIEEAVADAQQTFASWDKEFSRFREDSDLHRMNTNAGTWQNISPRMNTVLTRCLSLAEETNGAFDPSVGAFFAERGYGLPKEYTPPHTRPTYKDIELDRKGSRIRTKEGQVLEPASLVKGMAIDDAGGALERHGLSAWMINAGGDILTHGDFPNQGHWNVVIQHPAQKDAVVTAVQIHNEALATSGTYEVGGMHEGAPWHHQVNMKDTRPTEGIASLSVIAPTAEAADTIASIGFLSDAAERQGFLDRSGSPYLLIDSDGRMHPSATFAEREVPMETLLHT